MASPRRHSTSRRMTMHVTALIRRLSVLLSRLIPFSSLSHPAHYEACTRNRRQGAGCKRLEFHCSRQADRLETGGKSETFRRASPCRTTVKKHFEFASESGLIEKSQLYPARRTGWGVGGWGKKWKEFLETVKRFCETFRETTCETLGI